MREYKQITYWAGAVAEIVKYIPKGSRKGVARGPKKTKEEIQIPASKVPVFKAGKALKDTVAQ